MSPSPYVLVLVFLFITSALSREVFRFRGQELRLTAVKKFTLQHVTDGEEHFLVNFPSEEGHSLPYLEAHFHHAMVAGRNTYVVYTSREVLRGFVQSNRVHWYRRLDGELKLLEDVRENLRKLWMNKHVERFSSHRLKVSIGKAKQWATSNLTNLEESWRVQLEQFGAKVYSTNDFDLSIRFQDDATWESIEGVLNFLMLQPAVQTVGTGKRLHFFLPTTKRVILGTKTDDLAVWTAGYRGENQIIAVADTGVDIQHCMFRDSAVPQPYYFNYTGGAVTFNAATAAKHRKIYALVPFNTYCRDDNCVFHNAGDPALAARNVDVWDRILGHGTHVAHIAGGSPETVVDGNSRTIPSGVARDAKLVVVDISFGSSNGTVGNEVPTEPENMEKFFSHVALTGAKTFTNSWGTTDNSSPAPSYYSFETYYTDKFAYENDVLVIFAAGNYGSKNQGFVSDPCNGKNVLCVGATEVDTPVREPQSSYGPTWDKRVKPDIMAPGSRVVAAASRLNASMQCGDPASLTQKTGTSMAAPAVAGAAAIVRQYLEKPPPSANLPTTTVTAALVKAVLLATTEVLLMSTGDISSTQDTLPSDLQGFGRVNAANLPGVLAGRGLSYQTGAFTSTKTYADTCFTVRGYTSRQPLKVLLYWHDVPQLPGVYDVLTDDLNLVVWRRDSNQNIITRRGNDRRLTEKSFQAIPSYMNTDKVNNVEIVYYSAPSDGKYFVRVYASGGKIVASTVRYNLVLASGNSSLQFTDCANSGDESSICPNNCGQWRKGLSPSCTNNLCASCTAPYIDVHGGCIPPLGSPDWECDIPDALSVLPNDARIGLVKSGLKKSDPVAIATAGDLVQLEKVYPSITVSSTIFSEIITTSSVQSLACGGGGCRRKDDNVCRCYNDYIFGFWTVSGSACTCMGKDPDTSDIVNGSLSATRSRPKFCYASNCNGRGTYSAALARCSCQSGYDPNTDCSICLSYASGPSCNCLYECGSHGTCQSQGCVCDKSLASGYWKTSQNCQSCDDGYSGDNCWCSSNTTANCNAHGVCGGDVCSCFANSTAGFWDSADLALKRDCSICLTGYGPTAGSWTSSKALLDSYTPTSDLLSAGKACIVAVDDCWMSGGIDTPLGCACPRDPFRGFWQSTTANGEAVYQGFTQTAIDSVFDLVYDRYVKAATPVNSACDGLTMNTATRPLANRPWPQGYAFPVRCTGCTAAPGQATLVQNTSTLFSNTSHLCQAGKVSGIINDAGLILVTVFNINSQEVFIVETFTPPNIYGKEQLAPFKQTVFGPNCGECFRNISSNITFAGPQFSTTTGCGCPNILGALCDKGECVKRRSPLASDTPLTKFVDASQRVASFCNCNGAKPGQWDLGFEYSSVRATSATAAQMAALRNAGFYRNLTCSKCGRNATGLFYDGVSLTGCKCRLSGAVICSGHGTCDTPQCTCFNSNATGFFSDSGATAGMTDCDICAGSAGRYPTCRCRTDNCNGKGTCTTTGCKCSRSTDKGYWGDALNDADGTDSLSVATYSDCTACKQGYYTPSTSCKTTNQGIVYTSTGVVGNLCSPCVYPQNKTNITIPFRYYTTGELFTAEQIASGGGRMLVQFGSESVSPSGVVDYIYTQAGFFSLSVGGDSAQFSPASLAFKSAIAVEFDVLQSNLIDASGSVVTVDYSTITLMQKPFTGSGNWELASSKCADKAPVSFNGTVLKGRLCAVDGKTLFAVFVKIVPAPEQAKIAIWIAVAVAGAGLLVAVVLGVLIFCLIRKHRKDKALKDMVIKYIIENKSRQAMKTLRQTLRLADGEHFTAKLSAERALKYTEKTRAALLRHMTTKANIKGFGDSIQAPPIENFFAIESLISRKLGKVVEVPEGDRELLDSCKKLRGMFTLDATSKEPILRTGALPEQHYYLVSLQMENERLKRLMQSVKQVETRAPPAVQSKPR